jgi:hypothetical protein
MVQGCQLLADAVEKVSFLLIASDWRGIEIGESLGGGSGLIVPWVSGNRRAQGRDGWTKGSKRQGLQVLYDGREKKFVAGTGQPAEPHAFETMVDFEVSKAHLDALAFIPRFEEALRSHLPPRHIAGIFVTGMTSNAARQDIRLGGIVLLRDSHFETA